LTIGVVPVIMTMLPTNFALIKMNEAAGGKRSADAAQGGGGSQNKPGSRSAEDSVNGVGEGASQERGDF